MKKSSLGALFLCLFVFSILVGSAVTATASSSKDTSWWGKSGAGPAPVKDPVKGGSWWMPKKAPAGKDDTLWGNRGYLYLKAEPAKAKKVVVEKAAEKPVRDVYFLLDSANLTPLAQKTLDKNVKALKGNPKAKAILMGYASPEGSDEYNLKLSERRAKAVKDYLVKKGIPEASILTEGKGRLNVEKASYPSARKVNLKIIPR